jgi:hypothetical protein
MLEQFMLQIATSTSNATVPIVTAGTTTSLSDLVGQIVNQMGSLIALISLLLASPGMVALFNMLKRNKERNALAETTGIAASKVLDLQEQIVTITRLVDAILLMQKAPTTTQSFDPDKAPAAPYPDKPTVEELEKKVDNLKAQLNDVTPRLPSVTKASLRQN